MTPSDTKQRKMIISFLQVPCVELGDGRLLDESNSAAWLLSPDGMLGADEKAAQAEVTFFW